MLTFFETRLLNPTYRADTTSAQALRERVLSANLLILVSFGTLAYFAFLIANILRGFGDPSYWRETPVNTIGYGLILLVALRRSLPFALRAGFLVFVLYAVALSDKLAAGLGGTGEMLLLVGSTLLVIFFGARGAVLAVLLDLAVMGIPGWLITSGRIAAPAREVALSTNPTTWVLTTVTMMIMVGMLMISAAVLMNRRDAD